MLRKAGNVHFWSYCKKSRLKLTEQLEFTTFKLKFFCQHEQAPYNYSSRKLHISFVW